MRDTPIGRPLALSYPLLVGVPLAAVLAVLWSGPMVPASAGGTSAVHVGADGPVNRAADCADAAGVKAGAPSRAGSRVIPSHLILQLATVLLGAAAMRTIFRQIRQPAVVGEMVAGVLLGPSL